MRGNTATASKTASSKAPAVVLDPGDDGILASDLMTEIMGVVPTFGGRKIHVGFCGNKAFCNQKLGYVNVPALPPAKVIPTRVARQIRGFSSHEAAHLIWTDDDALDAARTDAEKQDDLLHSVWNSIEDYMIERNWLELYPGTHKNFTATEIRCCNSYMEQYNENPDVAKDLRAVGHVALTWCRSIYFGLKTTASKDCLDTLPASLRQRVWDWFWDLVDVADSIECLEHARQITEDIRNDPFDPADPPANQTPNNSGQPGQSQPGGQGGSGGGAGKGKGKGAKSTSLTPGAGSSGGPQPLDVSASISGALQDAGIDLPDNSNVISFSVTSDTASGPDSETLRDPQGMKDAQEARAAVSSTIGTVSRIIQRALQSLSKERWKSGRADGIIDDKRLAGVILGQQEIYRKKKPAPEIDTAVEILVDCSGSMQGEELEICQQLALILQSSFAGTPIRFEIIGYTSGDIDSAPDNVKIMAQAVQQQYGQAATVRSLQLYEFKGFDVPHHVALTTIGNMTKVQTGGTPTGDAILAAHQRLGARKERRHVMFVLTDGAPDDTQTCKEAVRTVESCGATVLGIGIQSNAVKTCFKNWVMLNDSRDLAAVVLHTMADMLFKDRLKVGQKPKISSQNIRYT